MKVLLSKAVSAAIALGALSSCSFFQPASPQPLLLDKAAANQLRGSSASWVTTLWSPPQGTSTRSNGFLPGEVGLAVKAAAATLPVDRHGRPTYFSESVRHRYVRTTSYSHQENEVGAVGRLSAMGTTLKYGRVRSAAADWSRYPVGTIFRIKGLPQVYVVDDYGSGLVGTNTLDIYHPTLRLMRKWATRDVEIHVVRWGSWERTASLLRGRTRYKHCARMYYATMAKISSGRVVLRGGLGDQTPSL